MKQSVAMVIADVDVLVVEHVSDLLERHGFRVWIAPPVHAAIGDWIRRYDADLCLIDISLRDGTDISGLAALHRDYPSTKIVVRTAETSQELMRAALDAGASGYVHKSRGPVVLIEAIRRVVDGEVVVEGSFVHVAVLSSSDDFARLINSLTPRQYECLELLAEGKGTVAIAHELGVSVMTVRSHIQAILGKLGVRSRLEAATMVARHQTSAVAAEGTLAPW